MKKCRVNVAVPCFLDDNVDGSLHLGIIGDQAEKFLLSQETSLLVCLVESVVSRYPLAVQGVVLLQLVASNWIVVVAGGGFVCRATAYQVIRHRCAVANPAVCTATVALGGVSRFRVGYAVYGVWHSQGLLQVTYVRRPLAVTLVIARGNWHVRCTLDCRQFVTGMGGQRRHQVVKTVFVAESWKKIK